MAIGYARVEFVKRSEGKTACAKASYNSRQTIEFHGNSSLGPEIFKWDEKEPSIYHEVMIPLGVHEKFKSPQVLWNAVETKEIRSNAQVAIDLLLALPDDQIITLEDRIHLSKTFVQTYFVDKGLAAQIDIHPPEKRIKITRDNREIGLYKNMLGNVLDEKDGILSVQFDSKRTISFNPKEFTGFIETDNNWHAHILVTTRRFQEDGLDLGDKARDLMPRICKGRVVSGEDWGKLWTDHQNKFFQEKGLDLRVDSPGIEPQEHLGPVRMRGRAFDLLEEHSKILDRNSLKVKDPSEVLKKITERQSVFAKEDVDRFIHKHLSLESQASFKEEFWKQKDVVSLIDKQTGESTGKFSSQTVIEEEASILRLADKIHLRNAFQMDIKKSDEFSKNLNPEQKAAFDTILRGQKLACLQGYAGTGKSHLLVALKNAYSKAGYDVRAFGPDNATAEVLQEKGFANAENVYRFLYGFHHSRRNAIKNNEVWILDEAGKIGNRPLLELLRAANQQGAQVILSGDHAQLSSVERGGMFRVFCEKYDSSMLQDIQRQKTDNQRDISKKLAIGDIGPAIDKLTASSSIKWASTKKEAMEALISKWALDTRVNPKISTLLIANSNDESRVLNEMVRSIKRQRGELSEKEFSCETSLGKVYLSVGDQIEFRKNDKKLCVTNGLFGTIIEADSKKFVVSIEKSGETGRTITFNPQEYNAYQLGYASTNYRSQGKTVDIAYVLHSPALNRRLFYVGLTRHSHEAYYFVSKDQAYCLSDLKRQALRENSKDNTLGFTTYQEIDSQHKKAQKEQEIQHLKSSDSFIDKMKGYGLTAFEIVKSKTVEVLERRKDQAPSEEFFKSTASSEPVRANVTEMAPAETLKAILSQEKTFEKASQNVSNVGHISRTTSPEQQFLKAQKFKQNQWLSFGSDKQKALQDYFDISEKTHTLRTIVDLEKTDSPQDISVMPHFKEWQMSCGMRNAKAQFVTQTVASDDLKTFFGEKIAKQIEEQSSRHQSLLEHRKTNNQSIEEDMKSNIEPLLYRLFPNGPSQKNRQEYRFGSKGALSIAFAGEKVGQFHDFESREGGGLLKLVQLKLGFGRLEAIEWAKDFLGMVQDIQVPKSFKRLSKDVSVDRDWVSVKPDPFSPAPSLQDIPGTKLHYYFDEATRHAYREENGDLLYYRLRLVDKRDPTKKFTPPLSYGYWKNAPTKLCWELKGFDSSTTVLYNLPLLKEKPTATVLVVEGEKTADQAHKKFPRENFVTITWSGGAGAVKRADWTPLMGRNVIVWPDNDKPGYQAGEDACRELRKVGVQSLQTVDSVSLKQKFPEKWDLADPLPPNSEKDILSKLLQNSIQKGIDPQQALYRVSSMYRDDPIDLARINEILWRVDERLRPDLEQTGHKKLNEVILNETAKILLQQEEAPAEFSPRILWQTLVYKAQHGKDPTSWEIEKITEVIQKFPTSAIQRNRSEEFVIDKSITAACEKATSGYGISIEKIHQEAILVSKKLTKQLDQQQQDYQRDRSQLSGLGKS